MNKNLFVLLLAVFCMFSVTLLGQDRDETNTLAEESIRVDASSASVLQWFNKIAAEKNIFLSYNASQIDLARVCRIDRSGSMTIGELLREVLRPYNVRLVMMPERKLVIQVITPVTHMISGKITEAGSGEKLYGAMILLEGEEGRSYVSSDENGLFTTHVKEGTYVLKVSYMGYNPLTRKISVSKDSFLNLSLEPLSFEIDEVTVNTHRRMEELGELSPSNQLSFNSNDLFSQIWILPGVAGIPTGTDFQVDGGGYDENQILLDGVPLFHSGHINSLFPMFNGDAIKGIFFHKGFFPAQFEGRLSSVTDVKLKEGNKQEHTRTLTLDMPAASVMLEGPIVKDKLSYAVGMRRSWLDFFDNLLSDEERMNHSTYDYNAKLSYAISPASSLEALAYGARDDYHMPFYNANDDISVLRWENQLYQLRYNTLIGKVGNTTSLSYTSYYNRARADMLGLDQEGYASSGIHSFNGVTEFSYSPATMYKARWGLKYSYETYDWTTYSEGDNTREEPIAQYSVFFDNHVRLAHNLFVQVGAHFVAYKPHNHKSYYSIQPRLSLRYSPSETDLLYLNFSKMEQFYHYLRLENISLPTDFRMPSIEGYKPRSSEHYEIGWKRFIRNGLLELSVYYKIRRNLMALRPDAFIDDGLLQNYVMVGDGESHGVKFYFYYDWPKLMMQFSYTYARSLEWFKDVKDRKKIPSLYDVPHQLNAALSYKLTSRSVVSVGGILHSGKVSNDYDDFEAPVADKFRTGREALNYRIDAGYTYRRDFGKYLLSFKFGFYNIWGNPSEEEILNYYSIHLEHNCLPYAGISFRF